MVIWAFLVLWHGLMLTFARESCLLVRQIAWGNMEREKGDQGAKFVVLISIWLLDLIWLVFSCLFLYGSQILGQLFVTGRGLPQICKLKEAINDSWTQNWDNLDHCKLFLQERLVQASLFYPSINAKGFWTEKSKVWSLCRDEMKACISNFCNFPLFGKSLVLSHFMF